MNPAAAEGVSFVIPVYNGAAHLEEVLEAILGEDGGGRPVEVIAVDDGSTDGSGDILARFAAERGVTVVAGERRGAAAAINRGVAQARHSLVAQVDQDVVVQPGWLGRLAAALDDQRVAAAQGLYVAAPGASIWARVMGADLAERYRRLPREVDHVATGNTVYRAAALAGVGLFDASLGYGYDNDLSYRLGAAGYRLVLCREAAGVHHWRQDVRGYLRQQYGQGYGRCDLAARHRWRFRGDDVSGLGMMLHGPAMLLAIAGLAASPIVAWWRGPWRFLALGAAAVVVTLFIERLAAGIRAFAATGEKAALAFAPLHLLRDAAWAAAIVAWSVRRILRRPRRPQHSMPRSPS